MQTVVYSSNDPHGTHFSLLKYFAEKSNGLLIEAGSGYNSSPLLYSIAHQKLGFCLSLENDKFFYDKFVADNDSYFNIVFIKDWQEYLQSNELAELIGQYKFDLLFVDNAPWEARLYVIERFKDFIPYILLHDCDWFTKTNEIKSWDKYFKYYAKYNVHKKPYVSGPPTLLGSNLVEDLVFNIDGMYIDKS